MIALIVTGQIAKIQSQRHFITGTSSILSKQYDYFLSCTDIEEWQGRQDRAKDELKKQTKLKVTQALEEIKVGLNNMFFLDMFFQTLRE